MRVEGAVNAAGSVLHPAKPEREPVNVTALPGNVALVVIAVR